MRQYILSRYGNWNEDLYKAWKLLMQSLYGNYSELQKGATEAIFCARPRMNVTNVSSWGPGDIQYDPEQPEQALLYLYKAAGDFKSVPTYQFDLVDLARQVIDNRGRAAYKKCMEAYNAKNITEYKKQRDLFMSLLQLQENLLSKHSAFMLGTWLQQARRLGKTPAEQDLYEQNARTQITYWGADNAHTNLHEYAHKEWAGLLTDFYMPRWRKFFDALDKNESKDVVDKIDYFNMEKEWANSHNTYPVKPSGDCIEQVRKVLQILGL
ncbi:alpha-N-acetylglucosaminidase C-terminal domain-containing protein [Chitinophagaceae bacterium LWZ2-11]